jgi:hypothetical protein
VKFCALMLQAMGEGGGGYSVAEGSESDTKRNIQDSREEEPKSD